MSESHPPPVDLRDAGLKLWRAVLDDYDLDVHEERLLVEASRTVDLCDELEKAVRADGAVIQSPQGLKAHPAAVELRQQRIALARLLVALRMPAGDEGDQVQGRRPQRRGGVRGTYGVRSIQGRAS